MSSSLFLCCLALFNVLAAEPDIERSPGTEAARLEGFSAFEGSRLRSALQLAESRLGKDPRCKKLFAELKDDGLDLLTEASFVRASTSSHRQICERNVALFTTIGGRQVNVCRGAFELDRRTLAALLVHEALHLGGQPESPFVEGAPTSSELTRRVRKSCSL